jgi:hypothetical protein
MRNALCMFLLIIFSRSVAAQTKNSRSPISGRTVVEGQPARIRLAPHVTTTIRLPEPVNSVIVGDSNLFQAEYSPNEPLLIFARAITSRTAESNLVISTSGGRQFVLLLRNVGPFADEGDVDLLVTCRAAGLFFIEEALPGAVISETVNLGSTALRESLRNGNNLTSRTVDEPALDEIIKRQHRQTIQKLYGSRIRVGIGHVTEQGSQLIVPFSVVSSKSDPIELVPPQVQLAGQAKGGIFRRIRWNTVQQLRVQAYQMSGRRLSRGERIDAVVVFERPSIKESTERLLLQIADSAAVDQPTLAPITFRQTQSQERDDE